MINIVYVEINMWVGIRGKLGEEVIMVFLINNFVCYLICKISILGMVILDVMYGCFLNYLIFS